MMFRKLSEGLSSAGDRIASALAGGSSSASASQMDGEADKVRRLAALGFGEAEASQALRAAGGDADRAAELLLASPAGAPANPTGGGPTAGLGGDDDDDEVMRRVLQQSVDDENRRRHQQQSAASRRAGDAALARAEARSRPKTPTTTAAASRAKKPPGQRPSSPAKAAPSPAAAAAAGPSGPLASHHPGVKVVPKLQDKSKEERVMRCADRLKGSPGAVDALHRALSTIRDNPGDEKYRTVDKSSAGYRRALEGAPGAEEMLLAMSFRRVRSSGGDTNKLVLDRSMVDPALLYLGISALEQVKLSDEYRRGKQAIEFSRELGEALTGGDSSESEAVERSRFLGLCPSEPPPGRGAVVQVRLADRGAVRRRFDADDTLGDVLNWLGAHGSDIPRRVASREWSLVDLSHYPVSPFDPAADAPLTLQYLGCWPSGKLELLPSTDEWRGGGKTARRTSRGLGSAPSDAL
jgi:hypothetical protein